METTAQQHLETALAALERLQESTRADAGLTTQDREDLGTATGHVFVVLNYLRNQGADHA